MEQLLDRPEFQSAIIPFFVALLVYGGLRKLVAPAWMLALFAAFLIASGLINGLNLIPLTGTRKIILLILGSLILACLAPYLIRRLKLQRVALPVLSILALLWVFGRVVMRMELTGMVLFLAAGVALIVWLLWSFDRIADDDARFHAAGLALLLGIGLCATAAASALLGQLALSIAAATGGVLLAWVFTGSATGSGRTQTSFSILPYVLAASLLGLAAVIFARLPWYALIPLAAIPLATSLVPVKPATRFFRALLNSMPGLIIALSTAVWVWQAGNSNSSGY